MTVSYFSRDDAEKAWNELHPEEQCKTRIVMQPSYYLVPITLNDNDLVEEKESIKRIRERDIMKTELYKKLVEILLECSEKDWDGYHANPTCPQSFASTMIFLESFPYDLPLPDLVPFPNGDLSMVWKGNGYTLIASVYCYLRGKSFIEFSGILPEGYETFFEWQDDSPNFCREWIDLINKITHKGESNHDA